MAIDVQALIENNIYSPLGAPVLPQECQISDLDILNGMLEYYKWIPIKSSTSLTVTTLDREYPFQWPVLYPDFDPTVGVEGYAGNYFYVGLMNYNTRNQVGPGQLNDYLLGFYFNNPWNGDPVKELVNNTVIDLNAGDVYYEEDSVNQVTRIVCGQACFLSLTFGIGQTDVSKIPIRHIEFVSQLVAIPYLKRLLAIRKAGSFASADFTLDSSHIEATLKEFTERGDKNKQDLGTISVLTG